MSHTGHRVLPVHIRWMIRRDMSEVLEIERSSFEFPWGEDDFIRCLRQRNCIGMVAEHEDRVIGFMIYELHKTRLHILNFSVNADCHRMAVGSQMIRKLISKLSPERRNRILLEVRETNLDAQLFFKQTGFQAISVLRDYYDDTVEDAYLMQYQFKQPAEEEVGFNRIARLAG
ncbi:MAG: ribosomal protein S18-alanine N-acetyltransferase [Pirellulales bacterium]|jgi:ribosomal-protein-alanine N-acetyltransferase